MASAKLEPRGAWRPAWLVIAALGLAAGGLVALDLGRFLATSRRLPLWDMAGNGYGAIELWRALADGRVVDFLLRLNAQDKWPFGFSLFLLPFVAAGEGSLLAATLPSLLLFAVIPALLCWVARELDPGALGVLGGGLAMACWLGSPLHRVHALLVMRELAGVAGSLLVVALVLRARRRGSLWAWRWAGLAFLGLFWTKYNYAVLVAAGLLADELTTLAPERRRAIWRRLRGWLWPGRTGSAKRWLAAAGIWVFGLAALLRVNVGVALWVILVGWTIAWLWRRRRGPRLGLWLAELPPRERALVEMVGAPLWIWSLSPQPIHPKTIFAFLRNRPGDAEAWSIGGLLSYLDGFPRDYAVRPWLGVVVLALAAMAMVMALRGGRPLRTLAWVGGLGFLLVSLHPYKDPRFLATVAPWVYLLAGAGIVAWGSLASSRPWRRWAAALALGGLTVAALLPLRDGPALTRRLAEEFRVRSGEPRLEAVLAAIVDHSGPGRLALLGSSNELSPALVRWRLATHEATRAVELVADPRRPAGGSSTTALAAYLERFLARQRADRLVAIAIDEQSPLAASDDFRRFNSWQQEAIAALPQLGGWRQSHRLGFDELGLAVLVWERVDGGAVLAFRARDSAADLTR